MCRPLGSSRPPDMAEDGLELVLESDSFIVSDDDISDTLSEQGELSLIAGGSFICMSG